MRNVRTKLPVVILKFGGRLLESPEKIRRAADYVVSVKKGGEDPVVVVSAPGTMTDEFVKLAREVAPIPDNREMDMLLSVGERVAISLLAMAVNSTGEHQAMSFTGSQVGIITDTSHTNARILEVKGYRLHEALTDGLIPIVAGFQGISTKKEITTLGRGGSDATAVALSVALNAVRCELVKEVGGVYTADPNIVENAVLHPEIDYVTLESMTAAGAKVVQHRAASLARQHQVKLAVKDASDRTTTLVTDRSLGVAKIAGMNFTRNIRFIRHEGIATPGSSETHIFSACYHGSGFSLYGGAGNYVGGEIVTLLDISFWQNKVNVDFMDPILTFLRGKTLNPLCLGIAESRMLLVLDKNVESSILGPFHEFCLQQGFIHVTA